jgi:hypothetical protein
MMLLPVGLPINHRRLMLSFGLAVPIFAALGGLVTFTTGAPLWKGLAAGAVVGGFFGLLFVSCSASYQGRRSLIGNPGGPHQPSSASRHRARFLPAAPPVLLRKKVRPRRARRGTIPRTPNAHREKLRHARRTA